MENKKKHDDIPPPGPINCDREEIIFLRRLLSQTLGDYTPKLREYVKAAISASHRRAARVVGSGLGFPMGPRRVSEVGPGVEYPAACCGGDTTGTVSFDCGDDLADLIEKQPFTINGGAFSGEFTCYKLPTPTQIKNPTAWVFEGMLVEVGMVHPDQVVVRLPQVVTASDGSKAERCQTVHVGADKVQGLALAMLAAGREIQDRVSVVSAGPAPLEDWEYYLDCKSPGCGWSSIGVLLSACPVCDGPINSTQTGHTAGKGGSQ